MLIYYDISTRLVVGLQVSEPGGNRTADVVIEALPDAIRSVTIEEEKLCGKGRQGIGWMEEGIDMSVVLNQKGQVTDIVPIMPEYGQNIFQP